MLEDVKKKFESLITLIPANLYLFSLGKEEMTRIARLHPPAFLAQFIEDSIRKHAVNLFSLPKEESDPQKLHLVVDPFRLSYLTWLMDDKSDESYAITMGPFITERINAMELRYIAHKMKLDRDNCSMLESFMGVVPFFDRESLPKIASVLRGYLESDLGETEIITEDHSILDPVENLAVDEIFASHNYVDENYAGEARILSAIEHGDIEFLRSILFANMRTVNLPPRFPNDPLRDLKNLTITLNSISLRAAIKGGVSQNLAHNLSHTFAVRIEQQKNEDSLRELMQEIIIGYAQAVRKYALKGHSDLIVNAVNSIRRNLALPLSLSQLAQELHVSREHLCRQFRREMGIPLTDYIHKMKIQESCQYLSSRKYQISDIALTFGYSSPSHYSKIFEKIMGIPPKRWQLKATGKSSG